MTLGNPLDKYAYFSKVEVTFPVPAGMPQAAVDKAVEEGKRFLQVMLPVLVRDHWPDWQAANGQAKPEAGKPASAPSTAP